MASTHKPEVGDRAVVASAARSDSVSADALVQAADSVLAPYLPPGRWPTHRTVERFKNAHRLEYVLTAYAEAMEKVPDEPAYPWNLASALDRLRLPELALVYMARAIRVADEVGDEEWSGAHAHLAWADIAIRAREPELATVAIEKARRIDPDVPTERYVRRLRQDQPADVEDDGERNEDSARKGAAVEHLIAASCILASDFQLNVSTSLVDDEGVDLVFNRRGGSATLGVQVKSRSWSTSTMRRRGAFVAQVREATFRPRADLFLLFVAVDARFGDYGPVWLIPSEDLAERVKPNSRSRLRFAASASPSSDDQWSSYRHERSELPGRILEVLSNLEDVPSRTAKPRQARR